MSDVAESKDVTISLRLSAALKWRIESALAEQNGGKGHSQCLRRSEFIRLLLENAIDSLNAKEASGD